MKILYMVIQNGNKISKEMFKAELKKKTMSSLKEIDPLGKGKPYDYKDLYNIIGNYL